MTPTFDLNFLVSTQVFLSVATSIKDYIEVVHQLIDTEVISKSPNYDFSYSDFGSLLTYFILSLKTTFNNIATFSWLKNIWNLPILSPDINSSIISEISLLNGSATNLFTFSNFENPSQNILLSTIEKFIIGATNSLFLWLPTCTAQFITLRRFIMQGVNAGYIAGLGSLAGSILWVTSIIFGFRFFVIPWLSLDIFRYCLGFFLLVKYMWDSYNEEKMTLEDLSKQKIFLLNFLLALTEQTNIYPFLTNLSIGAESSMLETFPANNSFDFLIIHGAYILGLIVGSLSILQLTCWFIKTNGLKIYMGTVQSLKLSETAYSRVLNFIFLYLTMFCAISSVPYYGFDYILTKPLGLVSQDHIRNLPNSPEISFFNTKAHDDNTRRDFGRHGRQERWKRRIRKYRTFDVSNYDKDHANYNLFTVEDLNYGFDKFWLRRKMRNRMARYRFFPQKLMRSFKRELAKPRLESYSGPRKEFFRILYEQVYQPAFHQKLQTTNLNKDLNVFRSKLANSGKIFDKNEQEINQNLKIGQASLKDIQNKSLFRKFLRKTDNRITEAEIKNGVPILNETTPPIYSKLWKETFSKLDQNRNFESQKSLSGNKVNKFFRKDYKKSWKFVDSSNLNLQAISNPSFINSEESLISLKKETSKEILSKREREILNYRSLLIGKEPTSENQKFNTQLVLHPMKFYIQKEQAFQRKLRYYTPTVFRKFSLGNKAPYFRIMMKRYFYYYKPTLRWERTIKQATKRQGIRKTTRIPKRLFYKTNSINSNISINDSQLIGSSIPNQDSSFSVYTQNNVKETFSNRQRMQIPTYNYSVLGKRISRYRSQIYQDVLKHWYYSPVNRILLKLDIDSFIKRQPKSNFLTKSDENLLHLRRFLLSEYYNTLRWYSFMEHYRTMKTKIGGTKSFASRTYNQQFQGTFKKIRHLFAITPSQSSLVNNTENKVNILKFDQPLFNNKQNSFTKETNQILHEELLNKTLDSTDIISKDQSFLIETNLNSIGNSMNILKSVQNQEIKKSLTANDYSKMTSSFYQNLKDPIDTQNLSKENEFQIDFQEFVKEKTNLKQELYYKLLKNWKRRFLNRREDLVSEQNVDMYLIKKLKKLSERNQKMKKIKSIYNEHKNRVKFLKAKKTSLSSNERESTQIPTGLKKTLVDGILKDSYGDITVRLTNNDSLKEKVDSTFVLKDRKKLENSINLLFNLAPKKNKSNKYYLKSKILRLKEYKIFNYSTIFRKVPERFRNSHQSQFIVLNSDTSLRKTPRFYSKEANPIRNTVNPLNLFRFGIINMDWGSVESTRDNSLSPSRLLNRSRIGDDGSEPSTARSTSTIDPDSKQRLEEPIKDTYQESNILIKKDQPSLPSYKKNKRVDSIIGKGLNFFDRDFGKWEFDEDYTIQRSRPQTTKSAFRFSRYDDDYLQQLLDQNVEGFEKAKIANTADKDAILHFLNNVRAESKFSPNKSWSNSFQRKSTPYGQSVKRLRRFWHPNKVEKRFENTKKFNKKKFSREEIKFKTNALKQHSIKTKTNFEVWWFNKFLPYFKAKTYSKIQPIPSNKENQRSDTFAFNQENSLNSRPSIFSIENKKSTRISWNLDQIVGTEDNKSPFMINANSIPFYAGWDQSLRKFVVTNRLLSRRDSGYRLIQPDSQFNNAAERKNLLEEFTLAPLKATNVATTLYWEIPFATFDSEQYFSLGVQGFAPYNWRKFKFRHTLLNSWLKLRSFDNVNSSKIDKKPNFIIKKQISIVQQSIKNKESANLFEKVQLKTNPLLDIAKIKQDSLKTIKFKNKLQKLHNRRKRYRKDVKRFPLDFIREPKGPTLYQVLPSVYISVFNKTSRSPRDRYLNRKLGKKTLNIYNSQGISRKFKKTDFTLRRRVKPQTKYHRSRNINKPIISFPRRFSFLSPNSDNQIGWRNFSMRVLALNKTQGQKPKSVQELLKSQLKASRLKKKTTRYFKTKKKDETSIRSRRSLKRRVPRQTIRPNQSFSPIIGGVVWPGDYLQKENMSIEQYINPNASKIAFNTDSASGETFKPNQTKNLNYFEGEIIRDQIKKHNAHVIKRKLEKVYRSNKIQEKLQNS